MKSSSEKQGILNQFPCTIDDAELAKLLSKASGVSEDDIYNIREF